MTPEQRPCTCHPDYRPPVCQRRYAASECREFYRLFGGRCDDLITGPPVNTHCVRKRGHEGFHSSLMTDRDQ